MQPFTRQLGARSGVQLNPIIDLTERFVAGNQDQIIATVGRFERGRIDQAVLVTRENLNRTLGAAGSLNSSRLNETYIHLYEAFQRGAMGAVVYRLNVETAELNLIQCEPEALAADVWSVVSTPVVGNVFTLKHMECFNEGITVKVNADVAYDTDGTTEIASKLLTIWLYDNAGNLLFQPVYGSLDPNARDDFGESIYLPDVMAVVTGTNVEMTVPANASVPTTAAFYGKDVDGLDKIVSKLVVYFDEDSTSYTSGDYDRAMTALQYNGGTKFGYLIGGGTRSTTLISKMIGLAYQINKQLIWDVPNSDSTGRQVTTPAQAIAFVDSLGGVTNSLYSQVYWCPVLADDPVNGGKAFIGVSGIQAGYRCARNAITDANGVTPRNRVIAGKGYQLGRNKPVQKYTPSEDVELNQLATARINPVIATQYNSGSQFVFLDSLTGVTGERDSKLIAVADMSTQVDDWVAGQAKEYLQLPMTECIQRTTDFLQTLFEAIESAQWLKKSEELGGRAFIGSVKPNALRPNDRMDIAYSLSYVGTVRAIHIQQTMAR